MTASVIAFAENFFFFLAILAESAYGVGIYTWLFIAYKILVNLYTVSMLYIRAFKAELMELHRTLE